MELKFQQIGDRFNEVKRVGISGEALAAQLLDLYTTSKKITHTFENELQSETWASNFTTFVGEEGMQYAQEMYKVLKELQYKMEALG